jgi:uncharacterized RDD family membrane protein YckC
MATQDWYFSRTGHQQEGPVTTETLSAMARAGQLDRSNLVWTAGMQNWAPAGSVEGIFPPIEAATTPAAGAFPQAGSSPQPGVHPWPGAYSQPGAYPPAGVYPQPGVNPQFGGAPQPGAYPAGVMPLGYASYQNAQPYGDVMVRWVASIIDNLILLIPSALLGGVIGFVAAVNGNGPRTPVWPAMNALIQLLVITLYWLYFALQECSPAQATIGKRAMGLCVTDLAGQRISFSRATGRFFGKYLSLITLMIGYFMAFFTEKKQALHDILAGTLVLKNPRY